MKKSDLVKVITADVDITAEKAGKIVNTIFNAIAGALKEGDSYNHDKFGTFKVVERAARKGRNPQTGKDIKIAAKKVVKFKVGKKLADKVAK